MHVNKAYSYPNNHIPITNHAALKLYEILPFFLFALVHKKFESFCCKCYFIEYLRYEIALRQVTL